MLSLLNLFLCSRLNQDLSRPDSMNVGQQRIAENRRECGLSSQLFSRSFSFPPAACNVAITVFLAVFAKPFYALFVMAFPRHFFVQFCAFRLSKKNLAEFRSTQWLKQYKRTRQKRSSSLSRGGMYRVLGASWCINASDGSRKTPTFEVVKK